VVVAVSGNISVGVSDELVVETCFMSVQKVAVALLLSLVFVLRAEAGICEDTYEEFIAPAGGMVFEVDVSDSPGFTTVMNPSVSYLLTSNLPNPVFPLSQQQVSFGVTLNQKYRAYVPGYAHVSICRATVQQPHGFNIGNWTGWSNLNPAPVTLPDGDMYSGDPNHPSVNTSWPNGASSDPLSPTCAELTWAAAQGFDVSPSWYAFNNCGSLESPDTTYSGPVIGSGDASLTACTTYTSSPTQNGMVVWVLPSVWDPGSTLPEDAVYAIVQDPSNTWLVTNAGFNSPAPPAAGVISTAPGGAGLDPGIFHYVPPGSTISVCTNGTTQSDVAIRPLHVSTSHSSCTIEGQSFTYSGDPFDFIGDGPTPSTACAEFNCVAEIGQVPLFEWNGDRNWGDHSFAACHPGVAFDVLDELSDQRDHLVDEINWNPNTGEGDPPHEFAEFVQRYLDGNEPDYLGRTPAGWMNGDEVIALIQDCPLVHDKDISDLGRMIKLYDVLTDTEYDPDFIDNAYSAVYYARWNLMAGMTLNEGQTSNILTTQIWASRDHIASLLENVDGAVTQMLAGSGIDLTSPLGMALLAALPEFNWPFNTAEQNFFVDASASDDLGSLWEDARGIIQACAQLSDTLNVYEDIISGETETIELPDWTPHIVHPGALMTDFDLTEQSFAPISSCEFATSSAQALNSWNQALVAVQSHMQFEQSALAGGAANYQQWQHTLEALQAQVSPAQLAFWNATVADANAMLEHWNSVSVDYVLSLLRDYRQTISNTADVALLEQLDALTATLELAPQESVAWLMQAMGVLGINPLTGGGHGTAMDMLAFACSLQDAIDAAEAYDDGSTVEPTNPGDTTSTEEDCYAQSLVVTDNNDGISSPVNSITGRRTQGDERSINPELNEKSTQSGILITNASSEDDDECPGGSDPHESEQWYLHDEDAGVNIADASLDRLVLIGLVDDALNIDHEDLAPNLWLNTGEFMDGVDNDNNGCIDDIHGCQLQTMTGDIHYLSLPEPEKKLHGTQVAGVMIAERNNGVGIRGINPDALLVTAAVGTGGSLIGGIDYLLQQNVDIINLSWNGAVDLGAQVVQRVASNPDVLFVVASGNDDRNVEYVNPFGWLSLAPLSPLVPFTEPLQLPLVAPPWIDDFPNLIVVSSVNESAIRQGNFGARSVHLSAPGQNILTTDVGEIGVDFASGTSLAAPMVAAAASLLMQQNPSMTAATAKRRLLSSAREMAGGYHATVTGSVLDIGAALSSDSASRLHLTPQFSHVQVIPGRTDNMFTVTLYNTGLTAAVDFNLASLDARLSFPTPSGTIAPGESVSVDIRIDATEVAPYGGFTAAIGAGHGEAIELQIRATGTEVESLPQAAGLVSERTGTDILQFDGSHVLASTGSGPTMGLILYRRPTATDDFVESQNFACPEPCSAGIHNDTLMVFDTNTTGNINIYQLDSATDQFIFADTITLANAHSVSKMRF